MPLMVPFTAAVNFTPTSTEPPATALTTFGTAVLLQIVHGQLGGGAACTASVTPGLVMPLKAAVIEVFPTARPVATPAVVMVAAAVFEEFHVALVRVCVLLSLYVPVAVNCCVEPTFTVGLLLGVTAIDTSAAVTVSTVEPFTPPMLA